MSKVSFVVPPLSRFKVRGFAQQIRAIATAVGRGGAEARFDIVKFLDVIMPQLISDFVLEIVPKDEMGAAHGMTYPESHRIQIREDVYEGAANRGVGRDRQTMAHELGHYVLHSNVGLARAFADGTVPRYRQSEWQADAFAGELLMDIRQIEGCNSPADLARRFGVSLEAATFQWNCWEREGLIKTKRS